ncbi:MAG: lipoyl protein ligase domain-containing protein [Acidimicrobiia bacterium]
MLTVFQESFHPSLDTAVSHALLRHAAEISTTETLRIYRPTEVVAFGKRDAVAAGFQLAVRSARVAGYESVVRLAGGRAAVFHQETIAFGWTIPCSDPRTGISERFKRLSGLLVKTFRDLGADARIGEVPGEYCPGEFSINLDGTSKVMGVGQRLIAGAVHVGGVIVVDGGSLIADVLVPVYRDLGVDWNPLTSGDLRSAVPGLTWDATRDAVLESFAQIADIEYKPLPTEILERAKTLEPQHSVSDV